MTETLPGQRGKSAEEQVTDLRRVGIHPDFWYPVAVSASVRRGKTFAARFAGERIALYRSAGGVVYALEDRCAHRQVPLSMGVVEGEALRCCYHAWAYRGNGRLSQIPYLPKGAARPPRGVRAYPVKEAYGFVFVFPGEDTAKYHKVFELGGPAVNAQPDRLDHVCYKTDSGFTVIDVWQDEASFTAFGSVIGPALAGAGLNPQPTIHPIVATMGKDGHHVTY